MNFIFKSRLVVVVFLIVGFLIIFMPKHVDAGHTKQVIFLIADHLTLDDLQKPEMKSLQETMHMGSIGLMNTVTASSSRSSPHTQATISAGKPALGAGGHILGMESQEIYNGEPVFQQFKRNTGVEGTRNQIMILNWPQLVNANKMQIYSPPVLGTLGAQLKKAGVSIEVYGNSDLPDQIHRPGVLIAADDLGMVEKGVVGEKIIKDGTGFLSKKTDYESLLANVKNSLGQRKLMVIDLGDLYRLEALQHLGREDIVQTERRRILTEINDFYDRLIKEVDLKNSVIILASTTPSPSDIQKKHYLAPIVMVGGSRKPGLLYSNSTRRLGLITNLDLATSILWFFRAGQPSDSRGQLAQSKEDSIENPIGFLHDNYGQMVFTNKIRPLIIKPYIGLQIATILFSFALFLLKKRAHRLLDYWLGILVSFPMALLLVGFFVNEGLTSYLIISTGISVFSTIACFRYFTSFTISPFVAMSSLTVVLIIIDLATGANFMKKSILGYDAMIGARYYGIGNEYMGVLIGASFMGPGMMFFNRRRFWMAPIYFGIIIWLMFARNFGANFGGTLAISTAALFWFWRQRKRDFLKYWPLITLVVACFFLLVFFAGVGLSSANGSHIGRAFNLFQERNWLELADIIHRKFQMNIKLIRYTPWSRIFLLALLGITGLFLIPTKFQRKFHQKHSLLYESCLTILVGSLAALLWNDSGIVAAAIAMIYGIYPSIFMALHSFNLNKKI